MKMDLFLCVLFTPSSGLFYLLAIIKRPVMPGLIFEHNKISYNLVAMVTVVETIQSFVFVIGISVLLFSNCP
jgi:hypothetical protein